MPATYIPSTTFGAAVTKDDTTITLAALTGISKGTLLVHAGEAMLVRATSGTTVAQVKRGYQGSKQIAHANGATVFYGAPDLWKTVRDNAVAVVGDSAALPDFCMPGVRAMDALGNQYIMVDLNAHIYSGSTVAISNDGAFTADVLTSTAQGSVGILTEEGTSDQWAWAQIYGYYAAAQEATATSGVTSAYVPAACSSVSSPAVGMAAVAAAATSTEQSYIFGMFITGAASSATTSNTSAVGITVPVWLNYPYVQPQIIRSS